MPESEVDKLEREGFEHLNHHRWPDARSCFERMLTHELVVERRARVFLNIMGTHQRQQMREQALDAVQQAIDVLQGSEFARTTEGSLLLGKCIGHRDLLTGSPNMTPAAIASYFVGATCGVVLERFVLGSASGKIAIPLAIVSVFALTKMLWRFPRASIVVAVLLVAGLVYSLLFLGDKPAYGVCAVAVGLPLLFWGGNWVRHMASLKDESEGKIV
jgi:hypothetical protein